MGIELSGTAKRLRKAPLGTITVAQTQPLFVG